ncbi:MAG: beta-propeller domain-containing protein [Thermoplasmata archaeon]|nr:beta-propeller domain-containing protein [Thermoplasmata archaeon]
MSERIQKETSDRKEKHIGHQLFVAALAALLAFSILGVVIMNLSDDGGDQGDEIDLSGAVGDAAMDEEVKQRWTTYLEYAPTIDLETPDVDARWVDGGELDFLDTLPEPEEGENLYGGARDEGDGVAVPSSDKSNDDEASLQDDGESGSKEREVEESDIIKIIDDRLFLLNSYRGFVIVDIEDPDDPAVESRLPIIGNPVSMYVVDFLAFVIVSGTPGEGETYGDWNSGTLYIVDLTDTSAPRVVQMVEINGYPVDSRRVGEVLYIVSYKEDHYQYLDGDTVSVMDTDVMDTEEMVIKDEGGESPGSAGSDEPSFEESDEPSNEEPYKGTEIVSIGFSDPENVGEVDRESFEERSENIHVTNRAIFVSGNHYNYTGDRWPTYTTTIKYVDISDPKGDIKVKDSITVDGQLRDRYQMDFFEGMLRVVTQTPQDPLWVSRLHVIDCRDTGDLEIKGDLLIDDAGSLMATRFAGDRAYTIHLPYSVDPLDVLDLSDPSDPKLCDVLEIPGWVEHMEVRGYKIIAIGVDDTGDQMKVAVSLFDVTDPYNAIMTDRVIIGEGYTYSEANWDDKALTILDDENLILIPFSSYTWERWDSDTYGVQLISFDLEDGTLDVRGTIEGSYPIQRTRMVDGTIITTSERTVQTIDPSNPDDPLIIGSLDLVSNVVEIMAVDDHLITCKLPLWGSSGARVTITSLDDPGTVVGEFGPEGLLQENIEVKGTMVLIRGIRPSEDGNSTMEIYAYDVTDPLSVVEHPAFVRDLTSGDRNGYYWYDVPQWSVLDDGSLLLFEDPYSYYYYDYAVKDDIYEDGPDETVPEYSLELLTWNVGDDPAVIDVPWNASLYVGDVHGGSDEFVVISSYYSYYYGYGSTVATRVKVTSGVAEVGQDMTLTGNVMAVSENLTIAYTIYSWWDETQTNSLNGYDISGDEAKLIFSLSLDSPAQDLYLDGDSLILTTGGNYWYYPYYEYDVVSDEKGAYDEEPEKPKTVITVFELIEGIPESRDYAEVEGYYYGTTYVEGRILLQNGYNLVGIDTSDRAELDLFGSWLVPGHVQDALLLEGYILISMGMWGIQSLSIE